MSVVDGRTVKRLRIVAVYDCAKDCGRTASSPGSMAARAAMRCSLPGFDPARWNARADRRAAADADDKLDTLLHLAREQGVELEHDLDRDGCPWGWVVSRWATSVHAYVGRRSLDSEVRAVNTRMLARLVAGPPPGDLLDWVAYAEAVEDGAYSFYHRARSEMV